MCGIAGWFSAAGEFPPERERLAAMCDTIVHRGPDDRGLLVDRHAGLGFQRLSIVDLATGNQPMATEDGGIALVFNGEVFNYKELRFELEQAGLRFKTTSDTEVLLRSYERWGLGALARLNGMFAIAIWDRRSGLFHLVRDRMGVKPVYYADTPRGIVFGSEIKAILASGLVEREVNGRALWDYLTFRYVPGPDTIWKGIFSVPPGARLTVSLDSGRTEIQRWWSLQFEDPASPVDDGEYETQFERLFEDAVQLRMQADVPVGITLSGGLDSSAVVAAAREHTVDLKTFSVAFEDSAGDNELPYARQVAKAFSTDHHEIVIGQSDFMDFLPTMVEWTDQPLADLASVPLHYVCQLAGQQVKVVLSGEGSDEILAGYSFERWARKWDEADAARAALPSWLPRAALALLAKVSAPLRGLREAAALTCDQRDAVEPITMTNYWSSAEKQALFRDGGSWPDSLDRVRKQIAAFGDVPPLNQALGSYCQDWLVEDLLMKADRMSMGNSVELRTPFLDYRLVEWAARLPARLKAGPNPDGSYRSKEILRRYARGRLPDEIIERPKKGFPVPVYEWLSGDLSTFARETLTSGNSRIQNWFDRSALSRVVESGVARNAGMKERHRLWNLLVLEIWMQKWKA